MPALVFLELIKNVDFVSSLKSNFLAEEDYPTEEDYYDQIEKNLLCENAATVLFCLVSPMLILVSIFLLAGGYKAAKVANGATAGDFVSVGRQCRIEGINYQATTGVTSTSDGEKYHCDEIWRYTFVVLDVEDVLDVETEADYFGLRSIREERLACERKSCERCNRLWGKDHLYNGQPIVDGYYATECWVLEEKE